MKLSNRHIPYLTISSISLFFLLITNSINLYGCFCFVDKNKKNAKILIELYKKYHNSLTASTLQLYSIDNNESNSKSKKRSTKSNRLPILLFYGTHGQKIDAIVLQYLIIGLVDPTRNNDSKIRFNLLLQHLYSNSHETKNDLIVFRSITSGLIKSIQRLEKFYKGKNIKSNHKDLILTILKFMEKNFTPQYCQAFLAITGLNSFNENESEENSIELTPFPIPEEERPSTPSLIQTNTLIEAYAIYAES